MNNSPANKNRRVLVIDDNRAIHDDFRKILSPAAPVAALDASEAALFGSGTEAVAATRFEVDSASQGQEGALLVKKALEAGRPYAMAFVDVRMPPGWDGVETTRRIWELDPNLQVVLCTAYSDYSWSEMFEKLGQSDGLLILKKPFDAVEAFQLAHALTEKWWLHQQSRRKMEELERMVGDRTSELRESQALYHSLVEQLPAGIFRKNAAGRFVFVNPWYCQLKGMSADQILGLTALEISTRESQNPKTRWSPELAIQGKLHHEQIMQTGQPIELEETYASPDGQPQHLQIIKSAVFGPDKKIIGSQGVLFDITERKRAEEAVRESEERFSGAFEYAPIGVALVSPEGRWLKVNRALCELVGYSEAELLTRTFQEITHPDDLEADLEYVRRMIAGAIRHYQMEKRYVHARGHLVTILLNVSLVRNGQGQPRYFISQIQDITERKRAEQAIESALQRLTEAQRIGQIGDWEWDIATQSITWSPQVFEILGRDPRLGPPRNYEENAAFFDAASQALMAEKVTLAIESGEAQDYELLAHRPNGELVDVFGKATPRKDESGRVLGLFGTVQDISARKRAEMALKESEHRYHSLFENMVEGYAYCRTLFEQDQLRDFTYVEVNSAFERLTGLKDVVGKRVSEVIPGVYESSPELFEVYGRVALTGKPEKYETYQKSLGIWFSVTVYSHAREHFVAVFDNITERKLAETALRESDEKFHQLADNITDVFWIRSPDMRDVHFISPAFERIWGRSVASLYANPEQWADFIFPEDRERVLAAFAALTGDTPSLDIEYRIVRPDGEIRWIRVRGFQVRDAARKLIRHTGIVTDITERHHAAERLRESERRFSDMLGNLELVSMMLDREARIIYCNDYLLRLTSRRREDVMGRDWFELFMPPDLVDEVQGVRMRLLADEPAAWHYENEILTKSGARRLIRWNNSVLRSPSGEVTGTASIGEDITDHKRLEAQLFQSQKLETVGKLAGGVAHEFNSILTAILGQSELLLSDLPAGSPLARNATEISKAAGRAAILTRQLLAYGRKQILQPEILDLNAVLTGMESTLGHLLGRDVDVRLAPAAGLATVKADAGQLEQVIMNLVSNARDAMPHGGNLTLETANVSFDQERMGRYPELKPGDYVMLAITDTGTGMSEAVKARMFEPFFTTKAIGQGTGLGLSTCDGIIKQSGGFISVYSEPDRGSTFKIYLPQVAPQSKLPLPRPATPGLPRGTETVLLVEDDPALREVAATLLRRLGYTVLAAANGLDALGLKQQRDGGAIDLLLTDIVMPHMSGKELAERVEALSPHIRILFSSAYTENAIAHQGALDQGVALLQKPFTPSALALKVREVLDRPANGKSGFTETDKAKPLGHGP